MPVAHKEVIELAKMDANLHFLGENIARVAFSSNLFDYGGVTLYPFVY